MGKPAGPANRPAGAGKTLFLPGERREILLDRVAQCKPAGRIPGSPRRHRPRLFFSINQLFANCRSATRPGRRSGVILPPVKDRQLTPVDRVIAGFDHALRTMNSRPARAARPNPADGVADADMSEAERRHAAGLMRVNHAGEIAAQGLYQGHAAVARDPAIEAQMTRAAREELDHLSWCEDRLRELDATPSALRPLWYAGSFAIGAASGLLGDRWSLGFIEETERQVSEHLAGHLEGLPADDAKSRAIVAQMRDEEDMHGAHAREAGAAELPPPVRELMRLVAKFMKVTAYRI